MNKCPLIHSASTPAPTPLAIHIECPKGEPAARLPTHTHLYNPTGAEGYNEYQKMITPGAPKRLYALKPRGVPVGGGDLAKTSAHNLSDDDCHTDAAEGFGPFSPRPQKQLAGAP